MTTLKIKNLNSVLKAVQRELRINVNKLFSDSKIKADVGEIVVKNIKKRDFGDPAEFTLAMREYYEQFNKTDPSYKRNKINIAFTGELLEDLKNNVKGSPTEKSFIVQQSEKTHSQYKDNPKTKKRAFKKKTHKVTSRTGKVSNRQTRVPYRFISTQLTKRLGYDYLDIPNSTRDEITSLIKVKLFKLLKGN